MNFLSHHHVARQLRSGTESPLFFVGNVLPDVLAMTGLGRLRSVADRDEPLAAGVRLHFDSDARFHSSAEFERAQADVGALLLAAEFAEPVRRRFFVAHVLVELALDSLVLRYQPHLRPDLYDQMRLSLQDDLSGKTERLIARPVPDLTDVIRRLVDDDFLAGYATPEGLAAAILRVGRRAGVANFESPADRATLTAVAGAAIPVVDIYREALLTPPFPLRSTSGPVVQ